MIETLRRYPLAIIATLLVSGVLLWLMAHSVTANPGLLFWIGVLLLWAIVWLGNDALSGLAVTSPLGLRLRNLIVPAIFGLTVLLLWQLVVKGFNIKPVFLPAPSDIGGRFFTSPVTLWEDFVQTVRAVLAGWVIGVAALHRYRRFSRSHQRAITSVAMPFLVFAPLVLLFTVVSAIPALFGLAALGFTALPDSAQDQPAIDPPYPVIPRSG